MSELHKFEHEAMKTSFTIRIRNSDTTLAADSARDAFDRLDMIEQKLSRYIHGSDVWQINHMRSGESLLIGEECDQCLRLGLEAYMRTGGLFDPTLGSRIEHYKTKQEGEAPNTTGQLMVDPDRPEVHCVAAGREVDLGGIGKGYALDRMAVCLRDWGIDSALVAAGASTQLAIGELPWEVQLSGQHGTRTVELRHEALSASGTEIQGAHILNPDPDSTEPLQHRRVWIVEDQAAMADAWSTASMLAPAEKIFELDSPPKILIHETSEGFRQLKRDG